jgi:hypothetical protein
MDKFLRGIIGEGRHKAYGRCMAFNKTNILVVQLYTLVVFNNKAANNSFKV